MVPTPWNCGSGKSVNKSRKRGLQVVNGLLLSHLGFGLTLTYSNPYLVEGVVWRGPSFSVYLLSTNVRTRTWHGLRTFFESHLTLNLLLRFTLSWPSPSWCLSTSLTVTSRGVGEVRGKGSERPRGTESPDWTPVSQSQLWNIETKLSHRESFRLTVVPFRLPLCTTSFF